MARHIIPLTIHVAAYVLYPDDQADTAEDALLTWYDKSVEIAGTVVARRSRALHPDLCRALADTLETWLQQRGITVVVNVE